MTRSRDDDRPWVLGLSASHNGAACLLHGDELVAAVQEERLSRNKRDRIFGARPSLAVAYCLDAGGIGPGDLDLVVSCVQSRARSPEQDIACNPQLQLATRGVPWRVISHHLGHATSAFATSGFADAAVLVIDGIGSPVEDLDEEQLAVVTGDAATGWEMISLYGAAGMRLTPLEVQMVEGGEWLPRRPCGMQRFRTLGAMYAAVALQIFGDMMESGKVMGLAPYGEILYPPEEFFHFDAGRFHFHDIIPERFNHTRRWPEERRVYEHLARSVQNALEVAILQLVEQLRRRTGATRLCYAGGVALNCVLNERLWREAGFDEIHVPPASDDAGAAIGAAYHGLWQLTGRHTPRRALDDDVGRRYTAGEIDAARAVVPGLRLVTRGREEVLAETVRRLQAGQFCGWFQGGSELGPRALGHRSILADPRGPTTKDDINARVKGRESFRPFAPAVLAEEACRWFEVFDAPDRDPPAAPASSPFMLRVWPALTRARELLPAVVHVDGTARVQTVDGSAGHDLFRALLCRFRDATGVPVLLNTSFNGPGEAIVETPEDALWCALQVGLDFVVIGEQLLEREPEVRSILDLVPRLTATSYRVDIPLPGGRLGDALPEDADLVFQVSFRWGTRTQLVPGRLEPLLAAIDGTSNGRSLLDKVPAGALRADQVGADNASPEQLLVRALSALRNVAILTFVAPQR